MAKKVKIEVELRAESLINESGNEVWTQTTHPHWCKVNGFSGYIVDSTMYPTIILTPKAFPVVHCHLLEEETVAFIKGKYALFLYYTHKTYPMWQIINIETGVEAHLDIWKLRPFTDFIDIINLLDRNDTISYDPTTSHNGMEMEIDKSGNHKWLPAPTP